MNKVDIAIVCVVVYIGVHSTLRRLTGFYDQKLREVDKRLLKLEGQEDLYPTLVGEDRKPRWSARIPDTHWSIDVLVVVILLGVMVAC